MSTELNNLNLNQWLYRLENRTEQEIQLGLRRITEVAKTLDLLSPDCKVITVAGTNGKGSTVSALEMIYHQAGYRVGTYTSPHLLVFNERIRLNLSPISDEALCDIFCHIESARQSVVLTYFEMATLAALYYFKQNKVDILILEVGIGGRLDATNIINPDLALITTIDFDHQDYLGDTLDKISYEKAGILRPGIPFIYADANPPKRMMERAMELKTDTYVYGEHYDFSDAPNTWKVNCLGKTIGPLPKPKIQLKSAAAAILASRLFNSFLPVHVSQLHKAMDSIFIPGRLELQSLDSIQILYDVSHNPQSARLLAERITQLEKGKVHGVFSALKDKDILGMILPLKHCINYWYPAQLESRRAATEQFLLNTLKDAEIFVDSCYNTPFNAFHAALNFAKPKDLIVVFGSFLTVGHVMQAQK